jgi:hypothetical protein
METEGSMNDPTPTLIDTRIGEHMRRLARDLAWHTYSDLDVSDLRDRIVDILVSTFPAPTGATPCPSSSPASSSPSASSPSSGSSPQPTSPTLPASDGTVDAAFVAANAGEYEFVRESNGCETLVGNVYVSDGRDYVTFKAKDGSPLGTWHGYEKHIEDGSRFRLIPTPATSVEGEPVNPFALGADQDGRTRWKGWEAAADAWRTHLTRTLASRDAEIAKLQAELAAVRGERDAMKPVIDSVNRWQDHYCDMPASTPFTADMEIEILRYRQHAAKGGGK